MNSNKSNQNLKNKTNKSYKHENLKEKYSNYPKKQNFLGEMNKTKLQNINKCIKRWKTKTSSNTTNRTISNQGFKKVC